MKNIIKETTSVNVTTDRTDQPDLKLKWYQKLIGAFKNRRQ